MKTKDTVSTLNDLIQINKDGQEGFKDASENVKNPELKTLFAKYSLQRSKFAGDLQQHVTGFGEEPEKDSSLAGAIHRGWIDLKTAFTKGDDHSILVECERGEDYAVEAYNDAIDAELPANLRVLVEEQAAMVTATHDDMRDRRDAATE